MCCRVSTYLTETTKTTEPILAMSAVPLEVQRKAATMTLRLDLPALAKRRCYRHGSSHGDTDLTFANALALKINGPFDWCEIHWPPHGNFCSLRVLLKKTFHCGEVSIHLAKATTMSTISSTKWQLTVYKLYAARSVGLPVAYVFIVFRTKRLIREHALIVICSSSGSTTTLLCSHWFGWVLPTMTTKEEAYRGISATIRT